MTVTAQTDFIACDIDREKLEKYGQVKFECDIQGHGEEGEWVEEEDVPVSGLDMKNNAIMQMGTGQSARNTDRDIALMMDGSSCGFGMSGWGGILKCSR